MHDVRATRPHPRQHVRTVSHDVSGRRGWSSASIGAALTYLGSVTVGTLRLRGHPVPRTWHARLFISTWLMTAFATLSSARRNGRRALLLTGALVPLSLLPWLTAPVRTHTRRHVVLALAAAPWYAAAVMVRDRPTPTRGRRP